MDTSVQRRLVHQNSEGQDVESEDSDEEQKYLQDPGEFAYNKRVSVPAIPGMLIVLGLVGELLLCFVSIGAVVTFLLDYLGEKKRCVMVFVFTFFMCHILAIYSIFPLIWLSWLNVALILIANFFILLIGGWIILQFSAFRCEEFELCLTIEKLLFTAFPALSVALWIWATMSVVKLSLLPYLTIAFGFGLLQLFLVPTASSFRMHLGQEDNIIDPPLTGLMTLLYIFSPIFLFFSASILSKDVSVLSTNFLVEMVFVVSASIFLATLLPIRQFTEHLGISYQQVVRLRWLSGMITTLLCYQILNYYGLTSHYLPWLPAGIAAHVAFGVFLSSIRFKNFSLAGFAGLSLLHSFWISRVPWSIKLFIADNIPISMLYGTIWINALLCLTCAYLASHGEKNSFSFFIVLQTAVFTSSEILLFHAKFYSSSIVLFSGLIALYLLYRLTVVEKLQPYVSLICTSVHLTKVTSLLLSMLPYTKINSMAKVFYLFLMILQMLKTFVMDSKLKLSAKQVTLHIVGVSLTCALNVEPLLSMLCYYFMDSQPSLSDITGVILMITGLSVMILLSMCSDIKSPVTHSGPLLVFVGALIVYIQPSWSVSWLSVLQWGNIISVLCMVLLFLYTKPLPLAVVMSISAAISVCPTYSVIMQKFYIRTSLSEGLHLLYILICSCVLSFITTVVKWRTAGKSFEKNISFLCSCMAVFGTLIIGFDYFTITSENLTYRACWQVLSFSGCVVSISLRLIGNKVKQEILVNETNDKSYPLLPILGNIAAIVSYLVLCMLSPATGFLRDVWYCGVSVILICLQKDRHILQRLSNKNQTVPTIFTVAFILWIQTFLHCDIWFTAELSSSIRSAMELIIIFITTPVYIVLWSILWVDEIRLNEKLVIFLMPLNSLLFLVGSTYTAWALGAFGIFSGVWMMSYKLPLEVDTVYEDS
ncbi:uncharacterized protein LOC115211136 [Octopus sinensis]|uniref:Uncharacterized protein LOC115211136 n=1 Tax=Octopus sinensis TaxID=2607531 RepID=A0A7E6ET84_9MOLL|nr:uncharacterized protein LOC115211136 [Octopus sinensis]XP_036358151.1 uncharacterized protein LOC115211136 [Octopus sinensis]